MNIRIFCLLPTLLIYSIYTMNLQESAGNQQTIAQPINTLRQRRNTDNDSPKQLPLSAIAFSSIFKESPRAIEIIQSTPASRETLPIFITCDATEPNLHSRIIFADAVQHSLRLQEMLRIFVQRYLQMQEMLRNFVQCSLQLQEIIRKINTTERVNILSDSLVPMLRFLELNPDEIYFVAELLNFIAKYQREKEQLPTNDIIREHICRETKNFTVISLSKIAYILNYFAIPIATTALSD